MELVDIALVAAGILTLNAVRITARAVLTWLRRGDDEKVRAVIEREGERIELRGDSVEELERSIHDRLSQPSAAQ